VIVVSVFRCTRSRSRAFCTARLRHQPVVIEGGSYPSWSTAAIEAYDTPVVGDQARSRRSGGGADERRSRVRRRTALMPRLARSHVVRSPPDCRPGSRCTALMGKSWRPRHTVRSHSAWSSCSCPATCSISFRIRPR
jgi:hypothetical protein